MSASRGTDRTPRWWSDDNDAVVDSFEFALARDTETFEQAFRLVHDRYVEAGYMQALPSRHRLSLFNALPATKVFVTRDASRVIATLTLIQDSGLGLPMDGIYRDELDALRARGRRLAEVSAFAMEPKYRAQGVSIVMRLMRATYAFAASVARLDDLCIAVHPRHADFYRNALNFHAFGQLKPYETVNGAPAVALRLDLDWARERMARLGAGEAPNRELEEFFFGSAARAWSLSRLGPDPARAGFTAEQFLHFFAGRSGLASPPGEKLSLVIRSYYPELSLGALEAPAALSHSADRRSPSAVRDRALATGG